MKALLVALPIALLSVGMQHAAAESFHKTLPVDARGEVEIVNVSGTVEVDAWDRAEVQVDAELGSNVERLEFDRDGQRTWIKVILPKSSERGSGFSDLRVKIPRDSSLSVKTVSADQRIHGVQGGQRLQAVSGGIETDIGRGELEVKTVSGDIRARGAGQVGKSGKEGNGSVRAASVSGDIQLDSIGPELELNTVTGDMNVRTDRLDRVRIKTTNGTLQLNTALGEEARVDAEAINGDLHFTLRGKVDAEFDIETFNGDIDNCFGPKPSPSREYGPGNELRFTEGKGDARVRIKTLNGGVMLCKR